MPESEQHQDHRQSSQLLIATAGHVDHGKTSLIKHLTGTDTDTLKEEKSRGLTINPGYAYYHFAHPPGSEKNLTLGFVDCPGHADFIPNMLAGVGSVAHALLVVACDDGIMPQTLEHLSILRLLGIRQLTIVLSKVDRTNQDSIDTLKSELITVLETQKFDPAIFFPVNNLSGEGIDELKGHLKSIAIACLSDTRQDTGRQTRFLVDRSFSVKGIGTVVTGTLRVGQLDLQSDLVLSANGESVRIRGIQLDQHTLNRLQAGQRAALNINIEHNSVSRGDWLLSPASYLSCYRMDVALTLLEAGTKIKSGTQYHLYLGASHHVVNLRVLDQTHGTYQISSQEALHTHHGDRFVIRDPAAKTTIGGGSVIDILVPRKGRSTDSRLLELHAKSKPVAEALRELVKLAPIGVNLDEFATNFDLLPKSVESLLSDLSTDTVRLTVSGIEYGVLISQNHFELITSELLSSLDRFHKSNKSLEGADIVELQRMSNLGGSLELLEACIDLLTRKSILKRTGTLVSVPEHRASRSKEEEQFLQQIKPLLSKAGEIAPRTRELVEATGIPLKPLERILRECVKSKLVIQVADNRFYLPETIAELASFTERLANNESDESGFTVIQFRDASGIGRNLCIEILEYFDRIGFTRRDENMRFLRMSKEDKFG